MPWKEVDLVASVVTVLPEREEKVRFSMPYALVGQMVLLRGSLPGVLSIESLQNQRVGFPWKTTSEVAAQDLPSTNSLVPLQNGSLALESFLRGDVDAIVIDSPVALTFLYEHPEVKTLDKLLTRERYALVFPSDADPRLVAQANDVIRKYRDTLEKRWIP